MTLFDRDGIVVATVGRPLPPPAGMPRDAAGMMSWDRGPISYFRLADGRWLAASVPIGYTHARFIFHLALTLLALAIGIAAFPIVRQISRRLERLQHGVELLGAGDLTARVAVEGRDEVARLATSFNSAAGRIERLVQGHKALLANASHELRTPLARIRLAVELMKGSADPKLKQGLEQDIAELDWLVDEILLASRLDTVTEGVATEELDLLALAAEECARYDGAQLDGQRGHRPGRRAPVAPIIAKPAGEWASPRRAANPGANYAQRRQCRYHGVGRRSRCAAHRNSRMCFGPSIVPRTPATVRDPGWACRWYGKSPGVTAATPAARRWMMAAVASW